jgi:anti-anti-sigma factor
LSLDIVLNEGQAPGVKRITLDGSLDTTTAPELDQAIGGLINPDIKLLVLDMKMLEFISSAGLRIVFKATKQMKAQGGKLAVANRQSHITKVFEIVKALPDLTIFKDDEELDEYLAAMQDKFKSGDY